MADADAGSAKLSAGDASGALVLFTRAIQSNELTAEAKALTYHHRGLAFHQNGQPGRAILDYTQALLKDGVRLPRDVRPRTLNNRGLAYESLGDHEAALRDFNAALKASPAYAEAYANRGNLHRRFNRHDLAIADFDMAIRNAHPRPKYVYVSLGLSLEALNKKTEAMEAYRRALSIDPEFAAAKERLEDLEEGSARERLMAQRGRRTGQADGPLTAPVVIAALPGNQVGAVRVDTDAPEPWIVRPANLSEASPPPMQASISLRPTIADREAPGGVGGPVVARPDPVLPVVPAVERVVVPTRTTSKRTPGFEVITVAAAVAAAPAAAPPPVPLTPAVSGQGFGVQLGSFKSEALAQRGWETVRDKSGELLNNLTPAIEGVDVPGKGLMYRLFAEVLPDQGAASTLCKALKSRGAGCLVVQR